MPGSGKRSSKWRKSYGGTSYSSECTQFLLLFLMNFCITDTLANVVTISKFTFSFSYLES
uniref:Uncharacterized protein n=1 Tax=Rhizophora mucronata TaxID=61149 RepID=A0A2P2P153_RHIMU